MPIKQLQDDRRGFYKAGRVRKGEQEPNKNGDGQHGVERPWFVLKDTSWLIPHLGERPTAIPILLPYRRAQDNFLVNMELYRGGGCYCRGDGESIERYVDPQGRGLYAIQRGVTQVEFRDALANGETPIRVEGEVVPCPGPDRDLYPRCSECKTNGLFFFMIRDPKSPTELVQRRLVYYDIHTGSASDIRELTRALNTIDELALLLKGEEEYARTGVTYIPCLLRRQPGPVSIPAEGGKLIKTEKNFLALEPDPVLYDLVAQAQKAQIQGEFGSDNAALPPPSRWEDAIEGEYEEFADVDDQMAQRRANIEAMRDTMPASMSEGIDAIREFVGENFDLNEFGTLVRDKTGTQRGKPIKYNTDTWQYMLDVLIERYTAAEVPAP